MLLFFTLINTNSLQAQDKASRFIGIWEMKDKSAKMEVFKTKNEYQAKLVWEKLL